MARQWLRDQWFVAPSRCRGTRDILRGRGGNGERETKSCPGRCCADAATDCQKSWGCTEEDGGHISFSSGPHVVITSGPTRTVPPRVHAEQATASSRRTGRQTALADIRYPWHPGHCSQLCIIHASSRHVLDVIAISAPAVRRPAHRVRCPVACSIAQIASPSHPSVIAADHSLRDRRHLRGLAEWEAVFSTLRTRLGHGLARGFTAGGFSLCAPSGRPQALPPFYTASMHLLHGTLIASVGSVTTCAWSFAGGLTLDLTLSALAAVALQQLASRASP
jgi:hypothetical protein